MRMANWGHISRSLLLAGWALLVPPEPLGTSLPPVSQWLVAAKYKTTEECERARGAVREQAGGTVTHDPNASALKVAAALLHLHARCMEYKTPEPVTPPK